MEQPRVSQVIKTESARQTVILVFGVAGTVASVWLTLKLRDHDSMSYYKMKTAWHVKHWADRWSDRFARLALYAGNVYNGEKL